MYSAYPQPNECHIAEKLALGAVFDFESSYLFVIMQSLVLVVNASSVPLGWLYRLCECVLTFALGCYGCLGHYDRCAVSVVAGLLLAVTFDQWYTIVQAVRFVINTLHSPLGNTYLSYMASIFVTWRKPRDTPCTLRSLFLKAMSVESKPPVVHTHAHAARTRNDASSFMDAFSKSVGRRPYFYQKSAADVRLSRAGCRTFFWGKDLTVPFEAYDPQPNDLICLADVDMYCDMPAMLADFPRSYLVSTFQPSKVASTTNEYSYTFDADNKVTYLVNGGGSYHHPVWNYGDDIVNVESSHWWGKRHAVYNVDRRLTDEDHQIVFFTLIRSYWTTYFNLRTLFSGSTLRRLKPAVRVDGSDTTFLRLNISKKGGLLKSTGVAGSYNCATIPAKSDDTLSTMARIGAVALTPATIKTAIEGVDQEGASVLVEYHNLGHIGVPDVIYPVERSVFRFQFQPPQFDPDAKPSLTPFMTPLMLGCYAPDRCKANDRAAVQGRILDVQQSAVFATPLHMKYIEEFVTHLIPEKEAMTHHPSDFDEVFARQFRPSQQAILRRAAMLAKSFVNNPIETFQKPEAYGKITDPRIISTIPGVNKLNYSPFVYGFTPVLRRTKWYAFGKTPKEIAERVASIAAKAKSLNSSDLSRCDGRISPVLRHLEHRAMLRWYHSDYHNRMNELMATQQNQRAITKFGIKYNTGTARASGSAETADFNSMDNAFIAYGSFRQAGYDPDAAWDALGLYAGDDGLTPDCPRAPMEEFCQSVGQLMESDIYCRGQVGLPFLARYYGPGVWNGDPSSICDVPRQLSKLHVTTTLPKSITPMVKLAEKLTAYSYSDANTPIIGDIARHFIKTFPSLVPKDLGLGALRGVAYYHADNRSGVQYPNEDSDWMKSFVATKLPTFDWKLLKTWLRRAVTPYVMLRPPLCVEFKDTPECPKASVVVADNVITVKQQPPSGFIPKDAMSPSDFAAWRARTTCKRWKAGNCTRTPCDFKHSN